MIDKRILGKYLIGRKCRPTCEFHNGAGHGVSPKTVCTIIAVTPGHGFTIRSEKCTDCGQFVQITHVRREDLELVKEELPNNRYEHCQMRHENGNCLPCGGFCFAVNEEICQALHQAYHRGYQDGVIKEE